MATFLHVVKKAAGLLLSAVGLGALLFSALGLLDPQGAQLANDSEPFGAAPSRTQLLVQLCISVVAVAVGAWLSFGRARR